MGEESKDMVAFLAEFLGKRGNETWKTNRHRINKYNKRKHTSGFMCA